MKKEEPKIKMTTINISIPTQVLREFDKTAVKMNWSRSTLIRLATEYFIKTHYLESPSKQENTK